MENSKPSILIVDDLPENIQILSSALDGEFELYFALNGKDALKRVASLRPDLILLDIIMPGMSGFEVCKTIKETPELSGIPIIFITALGHADEESEGLMLGAADYITKPFNSDLVRLRVRNHLELKIKRDTLEQRTRELEEALKDVRMLNELLPICASCKNVRNDEGYWEQVEKYFSERTDVMFSHAICPDCLKKLYPEIYPAILEGLEAPKKPEDS
ncbi:response regulator [Desulforegula conservatrix]|uniref:response regulator n=1 Tax=Desulforegula conservatrix TaxID=153026 RepID=UPI00040AF5E5|nr:response regulator [Desulforegula conservatrix]